MYKCGCPKKDYKKGPQAEAFILRHSKNLFVYKQQKTKKPYTLYLRCTVQLMYRTEKDKEALFTVWRTVQFMYRTEQDKEAQHCTSTVYLHFMV